MVTRPGSERVEATTGGGRDETGTPDIDAGRGGVYAPGRSGMLLPPGRRIGAYEILEPLGAGGMGTVYRARDTRLGRLVALKVVSADYAGNAAATGRLEREARLASSLNHPSIVSVFDVGEVDGRPFIVMELVDGQSLHTRLATGRMPVREAVEVASQVADGLAAAHSAGIAHRRAGEDRGLRLEQGRFGRTGGGHDRR